METLTLSPGWLLRIDNSSKGENIKPNERQRRKHGEHRCRNSGRQNTESIIYSRGERLAPPKFRIYPRQCGQCSETSTT